MPQILFSLLSLLAVASAQAATAYEALQVIRETRGDTVLNQLIEVRGESGEPQPQSWTILMNDASARGGIREFVVAGGRIVSERTPLRGYASQTTLPALDFSRLNLDSDGAFKVVNDEAAKTQVGFDSLDYTLRTNDASGAPMWTLRAFDYMGAPVGTTQISAEDGKVVRAFRVDPDARVSGAAPSVVEERAPSSPPPAASEERDTHFGGVFGFVEKTAKGIGNTAKKVTLKTAGTVQEVLTGERTIDEGVDDEDN